MELYFKEFLLITQKLNKQQITPLLLGSLGLSYLTDIDWQPRDIDIHVPGDPRGWEAPDEDRLHNWQSIVKIMETLNYQLVDLHEHEFAKDSYTIQFGSMDSLLGFSGIPLNELSLIRIDDCSFYLPTAEQYLKVYQRSAKDSYRAEKNNHKDLAKIEYLEKYMDGNT